VTTTPEVPLAPPVLPLNPNPPAGYLLVHDQAGNERTRRPLVSDEVATITAAFEAGAWQITTTDAGLPEGSPLRVTLYDEVGMWVDSVVLKVAPDVDAAWQAFGAKVAESARLVLGDERFDGDRVARAAAYLLDLVGVNIARGVELHGEVAKRVTVLANVLAERAREGDQG
jgi:hypothetical protein